MAGEVADKPKDVGEMTAEELAVLLKTPDQSQIQPGTAGQALEEGKAPEARTDFFADLMVKKGLNPDSADDKAKFADSYRNMERKAGQVENRFKSMTAALGQFYDLDEEGNIVGVKQAATPPPQTPAGGSPMADPLETLRPYYDTDPLKTTIDIVGTVLNQRLQPFFEEKIDRDIEKQKTKVARTRKDFADFEDDIDQVLAKQSIIDRLTPDGKVKSDLVEQAYLISKGRKYDEVIAKSKVGQDARTNLADQTKVQAFVETGGKGTGTPPPDIEKMTAAELEAFIRANPNYGK